MLALSRLSIADCHQMLIVWSFISASLPRLSATRLSCYKVSTFVQQYAPCIAFIQRARERGHDSSDSVLCSLCKKPTNHHKIAEGASELHPELLLILPPSRYKSLGMLFGREKTSEMDLGLHIRSIDQR